jgi:glutaconate CoA-transferase subunit A
VTVEEVVDDIGTRGGNAVALPYWTVTAIAVAPRGAHPSYAHGYYARDNAFYVAWDAIAKDRATFTAWMDRHVLHGGGDTQ